MKQPVKKRMAPSQLFFNIGAVLFLITAVPIKVFVSHPVIFVVGYSCSAILFIIAFAVALIIRIYNMDDEILKQHDDRLAMLKRKKNKEKKMSGETEES